MVDERDLGRLGDERNGSRRARVRLEHVQLALVQRELQVEQAAGTEAARECRRQCPISASRAEPTDGAGRTQAESPGVDAGALDVLDDRRDPAVLAVAEDVDVELERAFEEAVDERRAASSSSAGVRATRMPRPPSTQ